MKARQSYLLIAALAAATAAFAWASQNGSDANAQNTTTQTQTQTDQLDRTNAAQPQDRRTDTAVRRTAGLKHYKASDLSGMNIRGKSGDDEIGEISDVVINRDGKVAYVAVSFGGFLGLGDKLFAVPFESLEFVRDGDDADDFYARIDVTEDQLKNKPGFNQENWPDEPDPTFMPQGARTARQSDRPTTLPAQDTQVPR